jgi:hypothetical protein
VVVTERERAGVAQPDYASARKPCEPDEPPSTIA